MIVMNIREKKIWRGKSELIKAKGFTVRHKPTTRKEEDDDDGFVFGGMEERREPRNHTQEKKGRKRKARTRKEHLVHVGVSLCGE